MIVENNNIGSHSNQKTVEFQLDNSGGHLFSVLSQLYSKPVDSTIRELATNCGDAHIMSNNMDRPFIIRLPNFKKDILTLCFRDFGPGLSHNEIMSIYRIYGKSTKTNSNSVTGCLGLGSKSPYSISSTFYVKSYKNGKCSQYTCSMDNNSIPNITETPVVTDTYNENGLEVIIPFYKEVNFNKILPDVLKYFKVKPLVYIQEGELEQDTLANIMWHEIKDVKFLTNVIAISENIDRFSTLITTGNKTSGAVNTIPNEVIQLQIYYPLDKQLIFDTISRYNKLYTDENNDIIEKFKIDDEIITIIRLLLTVGIQIHAEPGRIAFAPSRETIKYTDLTLIYIIKELVKAATIYKKILYSTLSSLDTYEKLFKHIFLDSDEYKILAQNFDVNKLKNIAAYSGLFKKIVEPKMILGSINDSSLKYQLNDYKLYMDIMEKMNLEDVKKYFGKLFYSSLKLQVLDIFNPTIKKVDISNLGRAMVIDGSTPFVKSIIIETAKKIYFKAIFALYQNIKESIEEVFNMSDVDYMKYEKRFDIFKLFDLEKGYKLLNKDEKLKLKDSLINRHKEWEFIDLIHAINKNPNVIVNGSGTSEKLLNYANTFHRELFGWSIYNPQINIAEFDNKMTNIKHAKLETILDEYQKYDFGNARFKDIIFHAGITYQKLHRQQMNAKNKFWVDIQSLSFNFEDVVDNGISFLRSEHTNLPLAGLAGFRDNDPTTNAIYIANVAMWILYKYYKDEVEIQNTYAASNDLFPSLKEELVSYGILPEYLPNLIPVKKVVSHRSPNSKSMFSSSTPGEIRNSNIWYHDELNEENFADIINDINSYVDKVKYSISCLIRIKKEKTKWLASYSGDLKFREYYLGTSLFDINQYVTDFKDIIKNIKFDIDPTITNWNNAVFGLRKLILLDKNICEKELNYHQEMRHFYEASENLSKNYDMQKTFDYEGESRVLIIRNNKIILTRREEEFILLDSAIFPIPVEIRDEFQSKLFNENKICVLNQSLKIGLGINAYPELIDMNEIALTGTDGKMRKIKNILFEKVSLNNIEKLMKMTYPDYIFLNYVDNFPNKLLKLAYNPLPLMIKMLTNKKLDKDLMNLSFVRDNSLFNNLPMQGFYKPFDNLHYLKDIRTHLNIINTYSSKNNLSTGFVPPFLITLGKKNHVNFKNFDKLISTFGNEEILKDYHQLRDFTYKCYKMCMVFCTKFEGFDILKDLTLDKLLLKHIGNSPELKGYDQIFDITKQHLSWILKVYVSIKYFVSEYLKYSKSFTGKLINVLSWEENEFEETILKFKNNSKFMSLIPEIERYSKALEKRGTINIEVIKETFDSYIKPIKPSQKDIIQFSDPNEFFEKLDKMKRIEIMNKKINRRTNAKTGRTKSTITPYPAGNGRKL